MEGLLLLLLLPIGSLLAIAYLFRINWVRDLRLEGKSRQILANYLNSRKRRLGRLPPVYPNGWFALLESDRLRNGEVKHVAALGENFAVFRTEKGEVSILDAYCPHLGANMAEGGRVKGDCLECPFHGWLFSGNDGRCQSIPYAEKVPQVARTKRWESCEVNRIIFVWYHSEATEPFWYPSPNPQVSSNSWRYQGRNEFLINCHIQDIAENGADFAHLSAVHGPAVFLKDNVPWIARHSWTNASWTPHYATAPSVDTGLDLNLQENGQSEEVGIGEKEEHERDKLRHTASMRIKHSLILMDKFTLLDLDVRVQQIGPGYVELMLETALGPMCIFQTVTPMEPLLQKVTHLIFSPPLLAPFASLLFLGECLMFERDVAIWNKKRFERQPILVKEDRAILAYRRWYAQFYSQHSPSYHAAVKSLQW